MKKILATKSNARYSAPLVNSNGELVGLGILLKHLGEGNGWENCFQRFNKLPKE